MKNNNELELCIITSLIISLSITSHLISSKIIYFFGESIIPSTLTYMLVLALFDYTSTKYKKNIVFTLIFLESICNLIFIFILKFVLVFNSPPFSIPSEHFIAILEKTISMYIANLIGSVLLFIANFFSFTFLLKRKTFSFIQSALISSIPLLIIYTPITDYIAFNTLNKGELSNVIITNIASNFLSFFFWIMIIEKSLLKDTGNND